MRLTLRGLLAYLDDRMAPESAAQVGEYIQDHDKIRQLTDRIKRVVRRRRLSTPEVADRNELPPLHQDDPNEVASFLDGAMTSEQEADFEEICIDTDVYLAEVAACHQIMTFGNDTLKVPPLAKQRMIGLVKGPEAIPMKVVPREARPSKPPLWEVSDAAPGHPEEDNQALLEPIYHDLLATRWSKALAAVAALLLVGFLGYIVWSMPWSKANNNEIAAALAEKNGDAATLPAEKLPAEKTLVEKPVAKEPAKTGGEPTVPVAAPTPKVHAIWPFAIVGTEGQPQWQGPIQTLAGIAGMLAARPTLPPNVLLGIGKDTSPKTPDALVPLPTVVSKVPRVPAPERTSHVLVALNGADTLGMFLQQEVTGDFHIMKPQAPLLSNNKLIALPGYSGHVSFQSGLKVILLGQFSPQLQANPYAEASIELHPSSTADADLTLHTGRLILFGKPAQPGSISVRVRYFGDTWQITLPTGSELGIQARNLVTPGDGPWMIERHLELLSSKGAIEIKHEDQAISLLPKQRVEWNSTLGENATLKVSDLVEVPLWLAKYQTAPKEAVDSLVALRARTHSKLDREASDLKWFGLACEETLEDSKLIDRQAALLGLCVLGRMKPVITLMNDANANGRRKYSHEVVHLWLNQDVANAASLTTLLKEQGFADADATLLLSLFRGTTQATAAQLRTLLQHLSHDRVAIREQAWKLLTQLAPERPNIYDPIGPVEQRTKAITRLSSVLFPKPASEVPPPP